MMNKHLLIIIFTFFCGFYGTAQKTDGEKIEQLKIAFFTEELDLSSSEAKRFWPVYNKYNKKYDKLKSNQWSSINSRLNEVKSLNQEEATQLLKDYMDYKRARVEYREEFVDNLKEVITPKQIMMLKKAEYDFHKKLLKQYQSDKSSKN